MSRFFKRRAAGWKPVVVDGFRFLSSGEADRYTALKAQRPQLVADASDTHALLVCTAPGLTETFRLAGKVAGNKHHAKRTVVDGHTFQSEHEARRYAYLRALQDAGEITDLQPHPTFEFVIGGVYVGKFTPDYQYTIAVGLNRGEVIVEDAKYVGKNGKSKGTKTEAYQLRKKLLWACHRIVITEVFASR